MMLTLVVNNDCPFRCKYCFMPKHVDYRELDEDTFLRAFELLKPRRVHAFGTEPLMSWNLIAWLTEWCSKHRVPFGITTNGYLLTRKRAEFLAEHRVWILCSIDGTREAHDKWRVGRDGKPTWHIVAKNFAYWNKLAREMNFHTEAACCLTPEVIRDLPHVHETLIKLGFKGIDYNIVEDFRPFHYTRELIHTWMRNLLYVCRKWNVPTAQVWKYITKPRLCKTLSGVCGIARGELCLAYDGTLWACHRSVYVHPVFSMGTVKKPKLERRRFWASLRCKQCQRCWVPECSTCPVVNMNTTGTLCKNEPEKCAMVRATALVGLWLRAERHQAIFDTYHAQSC